jgi:hypothetical protein
MAVALRRQEFELQELDSLSLIAPGLLTRAFSDAGANDPFFAGLRAIPGGNEPVIDDNGLPLDTPDKLERFHVVDSAYLGERHANRENFGYNIKELEIEPSPVKGSGPNDEDISTNAGRMKLVVSSTLHADAEKKKRDAEVQFLIMLQDIRDEGEYLRQLQARIAEIDKKLEQVQARRGDLQEIEDTLNAGDMQYGATPAERRANRLRVAGRLGLDTQDGKIGDDMLDRMIREEIARRREQLDREERELRRQREELIARYEHAEKNAAQHRQRSSQSLVELPKITPEVIEQSKTNPAAISQALFTKVEAPAALTGSDLAEMAAPAIAHQALLDAEDLMAEDQPKQQVVFKPATNRASVASSLSAEGQITESNVIVAMFQKVSDPVQADIDLPPPAVIAIENQPQAKSPTSLAL